MHSGKRPRQVPRPPASARAVTGSILGPASTDTIRVVANERMYPMLPCRDLDEAIAFYTALGFSRTYRQLRPNPYAVVAREDMRIHLFGMPQFDPTQSYGSASIVVPNGMRCTRRSPTVVRPRKRFGTGLSRHLDASVLDRARALLFRAELAVRLGKRPLAQSSLSEVRCMTLDDDERAAIAEELDHASELVAGLN